LFAVGHFWSAFFVPAFRASKRRFEDIKTTNNENLTVVVRALFQIKAGTSAFNQRPGRSDLMKFVDRFFKTGALSRRLLLY
jgi:hypothetical protein